MLDWNILDEWACATDGFTLTAATGGAFLVGFANIDTSNNVQDMIQWTMNVTSATSGSVRTIQYNSGAALSTLYMLPGDVLAPVCHQAAPMFFATSTFLMKRL